MFIDSHAHYNGSAFDEDREALLASLPEGGVDFAINVGYDIPASLESIRYAEEYPHIYAAVGVHPESAESLTDAAFETLEKLAGHEKVVAVGEMGLDYYYDDVPRDVQKAAFRRQIHLAQKIGKPVIIHDREAHGDCLTILKEEGVNCGVMHCFSGSVEFMREVLRLGLYVALGGVVTYKNARQILDVAKEVPMERLLLETDCPYLTPVPFRSKRNSSLNLVYVAEKIAELRGMEMEEVARITAENTRKLFNF